MRIPEFANELNTASADFEVGRLQYLRKNLHGLYRRPSSGIFSKRTIHKKYAFHDGGRSELQFNIGKEVVKGKLVVRHGVAFSLELSQTLPTIDPLRVKIQRFNDYICSHPEDFPDFHMWHHLDGKRSPERQVSPIDEALIVENCFIMLGRWVPSGDENLIEVLQDFDQLLPLYRYVETDGEQKLPPPATDFTPGCPNFVLNTTITAASRTIDVALRHKFLQRALYKHLSLESGSQNVRIEHPLDLGVRVDAAVRKNGCFSFYEVKVAPTVQSCLRAGIGQLIEYAYWPSDQRAIEIIIVGEPPIDNSASAYLNLLRERFSLPIWYRQIDISGNCLGPKS